MKENKEYEAALKIIYGSLAYQNLSVTVTVEKIMRFFFSCYEGSGEKRYLDLAFLHLKVYLEMGFVYEEQKELFDALFLLAGEDKEPFFRELNGQGKAGKEYSKNEIKSMIRRWSSSRYHTKTIDEVVEDILEKVGKKEIGIYYYHSNNNPKQARNDEVYELVIGEFESYLHDINRNKYYKLA